MKNDSANHNERENEPLWVTKVNQAPNTIELKNITPAETKKALLFEY